MSRLENSESQGNSSSNEIPKKDSYKAVKVRYQPLELSAIETIPYPQLHMPVIGYFKIRRYFSQGKAPKIPYIDPDDLRRSMRQWLMAGFSVFCLGMVSLFIIAGNMEQFGVAGGMTIIFGVFMFWFSMVTMLPIVAICAVSRTQNYKTLQLFKGAGVAIGLYGALALWWAIEVIAEHPNAFS